MSRPDENKNEHPVVHPIPPVYRADSRILILSSFPSVKSRETGFFYGHPQNRFWKVTAAVCGEEVPQTVEEKKAFLLRNHIAVWDVIASCVITGSSDASIRDVVLVAALDDSVVTNRSARLCDVLDAALVCALDVVAEREEGIGA